MLARPENVESVALCLTTDGIMATSSIFLFLGSPHYFTELAHLWPRFNVFVSILYQFDGERELLGSVQNASR